MMDHSPLLLCHLFCPPSADLDLVGPPVQSCSVCCFFFFLPTAAVLLLVLLAPLLLSSSLVEVTRALGAASVEPAVLVVRFDRAILLYSTHTAVLVPLLFAFLDGCRVRVYIHSDGVVQALNFYELL